MQKERSLTESLDFSNSVSITTTTGTFICGYMVVNGSYNFALNLTGMTLEKSFA